MEITLPRGAVVYRILRIFLAAKFLPCAPANIGLWAEAFARSLAQNGQQAGVRRVAGQPDRPEGPIPDSHPLITSFNRFWGISSGGIRNPVPSC